MRLGAIIAGGQSRRFGCDKAKAVLRGRVLIEHVRERLAPQVDALVVVGRDWPGLVRVDDRPSAGLGPLGGLLGALARAADHGFQEVLTVPCDSPDIPIDLAHELAPATAYVVSTPVIGLWRTDLHGALAAHLARQPDRSVRRWAAGVGARPVALRSPLANLNTPEELAAFSQPADPRSSR